MDIAEKEIQIEIDANGDPVVPQCDNPLQCRFCGKIFTRSFYRREHERIHTGERPYACNFCGKKFNSQGSCRKHEKIHMKSATSYECNHCGKSFDDHRTLVVHTKTHNADKPYACHICGRSFGFEAVLKKHLMFHDGQKQFQCLVCSKSFTTTYELRMHVRSHSEDKPYKCRYCNLSFPNSRRRNMHERCHEKASVHQCSKCGTRFDTANALATHEAKSSLEGSCSNNNHEQDIGFDEEMSQSSHGTLSNLTSSSSGVSSSSGSNRDISTSDLDIGLLGGEFTDTENTQVNDFNSREYEASVPYPSSSASLDNRSSSFPLDNRSTASFSPSSHVSDQIYPTSLLHATEHGIVVKQEKLDDGTSVSFPVDSKPSVSTSINNRSTASFPLDNRSLSSFSPSSHMSDHEFSNSSFTSQCNAGNVGSMRRQTSCSSSNELSVVTSDSKSVQTETSSYIDSLLSQLEELKQVHECKHCGIVFRNYSMFLVHKTLHVSASDPFVCHICGEKTRDNVDFNAHMIWHMK